jgi:hypothetical protein
VEAADTGAAAVWVPVVHGWKVSEVYWKDRAAYWDSHESVKLKDGLLVSLGNEQGTSAAHLVGVTAACYRSAISFTSLERRTP